MQTEETLMRRADTQALLEDAASAGPNLGPLLRLEHAVIRADEVAQALEWYGQALGLEEVGRDGGCVYLSCGGENGFDLGLIPGGAGLDHFSFSVHDTETLRNLAESLREASVPVAFVSDPEPEIAAAIRLTMPATGHGLEIVVREARKPYQLFNERSKGGATAPFDINHVTFGGGDVAAFAGFLVRNLGFRLSDVYELSPAEPLRWAFLRVGENHHDTAMLPAPRVGLHHVAFAVQDVAALAHFADRISRIGSRAEAGIARHLAGHNLFYYVRDPSGNRIELLADMALVNDRGAGVQIWSYADPAAGFNAWSGDGPPQSWLEEVT
jgi:catechol 2,3-dioxygenase